MVYDPRDLNDRAAQRSRISFSDLGTAARGIRGTGTLGRHAYTGEGGITRPNSPVIAPVLMSRDDILGNGDCDAWNSVQLRLGERDRELRGE